jgi:hypothetical protein
VGRASQQFWITIVTLLASIGLIITNTLRPAWAHNYTFVAIPSFILLGATTLLISRRLYSKITANVTIAIGGPPAAGKTVYINVLCCQLTEGESKSLAFTPETQTAQHVYRTIGELRTDQWPSATGADRIDRYRGTVALRRKSALSTLANGRTEFKVEFGDAAGENWLRLADEAEGRLSAQEVTSAPVPKIVDSSFLTYIGESDALFYLIDATLLKEESTPISEITDDILSTITILRTAEGGRPGSSLLKPVAIILSKFDNLAIEEEKALAEFTRTGRIFADLISSQFTENLELLSRLKEVLSRQVDDYGIFMVSSLIQIQTRYRRTRYFSVQDTTMISTEAPLEWAFQVLGKRRSFRSANDVTW